MKLNLAYSKNYAANLNMRERKLPQRAFGCSYTVLLNTKQYTVQGFALCLIAR